MQGLKSIDSVEWEKKEQVSFEDISLELPSGDAILSGVSGEFRAGRMCAIMGPSGAGKTSLMNVLCGKASYATVSGVVRFNGQEGDFNDYKTVMGFVPQEDVVHEGRRADSLFCRSEKCFRH